MAETAQAQAQAPAQPTEVGKWNTTRPMGDCCWLGVHWIVMSSLGVMGLVRELGGGKLESSGGVMVWGRMMTMISKRTTE